MSVQFIATRRTNQQINKFIESVDNSESDADVLKMTEEFINSYRSAFSLSESGASRRFIAGGVKLTPSATPSTSTRPTKTGPTKQPPIVYEPQACDDASSPCISSVAPSKISGDEIGKARITLTGSGFVKNQTLVFICSSDVAKCNGVVPNSKIDTESTDYDKFDTTGVVVLDEKTLTFIMPSTLELSCRVQDDACLGGLIKGYPVTPGNYFIEVQTRSGTSNRIPFSIGK